MTKGIIASIYLFIGLITAILVSLDVLTIGLMGYQTNLCAASGDINCLANGITKMVLFLVDIVIGPLLIAANLMTNPALGLFGVIIGFIIIWFVYGKKE